MTLVSYSPLLLCIVGDDVKIVFYPVRLSIIYAHNGVRKEKTKICTIGRCTMYYLFGYWGIVPNKETNVESIVGYMIIVTITFFSFA